MDLKQTDHLKAYETGYWVLAREQKVEWLLNYRGGAFVMEGDPATVREARIRGVLTQDVSAADLASIYADIEQADWT